MLQENQICVSRAERIAAKVVVFAGVLAIFIFAKQANAADLAILRNGFNISHDHHLVMGTTTRLYFSADDSNFTDVPSDDIASYEKDIVVALPSRSDAGDGSSLSTKSVSMKSVPDLNRVVDDASAAYHLDPDLVNSVIHAESGFNSRAVSPNGARGLMQLMPATASQLGVDDAFDPQANVEGGSHYLRELLERYNFDLVKALAAYNAGPGRVEQYQGVPPFRETRAYVARIVHEYNIKKIAQEKAASKLNRVAAKTKTPSHSARKPALTLAAAVPSR
jgi:soluble lytic murein transglycosylase-like protein